jgi:hypothetical protein
LNIRAKSTGRRAIDQSYVIRNLHVVPRNSHGRTDDGRWFPPGWPVWEFDVQFYPSYVLFETDTVRAKHGGQARDKIKSRYPNAVRYDF